MSRPRTWVEVSARAVRHNLRSIKKFVGAVPIAPVIKANAYGHGLATIVSILAQQSLWGFCVAYGTEALQVRSAGWAGRILVMSFWQSEELPALAQARVDCVVWDDHSFNQVLEFTRRQKKHLTIHLKIDTGTSRIGFSAKHIAAVKLRIKKSPYIKLAGVFSHLANSEDSRRSSTIKQIKYFTTLSDPWAHERGIIRHLACTAAALRFPEARFGLIRLGIGLYGLWPSEATQAEIEPRISLQPTLSWKAQISQIKTVPAGTSVGYGGTWVAKRPAVIATIPVGYSDGYYRSWSNKVWVTIRGHRAPVVGRVSMNLIMVDATRVPKITLSDTATLLGPGITADQLGTAGNTTLHYEVMSTIHPAIPRIII